MSEQEKSIEIKKDGIAIPIAVVLTLVTSIATAINSCSSGSNAKLDSMQGQISEIRNDIKEIKNDQKAANESRNKDIQEIQNKIVVLQYGKQDRDK